MKELILTVCGRAAHRDPRESRKRACSAPCARGLNRTPGKKKKKKKEKKKNCKKSSRDRDRAGEEPRGRQRTRGGKRPLLAAGTAAADCRSRCRFGNRDPWSEGAEIWPAAARGSALAVDTAPPRAAFLYESRERRVLGAHGGAMRSALRRGRHQPHYPLRPRRPARDARCHPPSARLLRGGVCAARQDTREIRRIAIAGNSVMGTLFPARSTKSASLPYAGEPSSATLAPKDVLPTLGITRRSISAPAAG
jgi:hypothetical protein